VSKGLFAIIDAQDKVAQAIGESLTEQDIKPRKSVDISTRFSPGRKRSKRLEAAKKEYKDSSKKAREAVFNYNFKGIQENGIAWKYMNTAAKEAWFAKMMADENFKIPPKVAEWAISRGLLAP